MLASPFDEWVKHYDGPRAGRMREARLDAERRPANDPYIMRLDAFVKVELLPKLFADVVAKQPKARLIQGRHDELTAKAGPWFHAVGKAMKAAFNGESRFLYGPGHNAEEIGEWYGRQVTRGLRPWPSDADEWDASQGPGPLEAWAQDCKSWRPNRAVRAILAQRLICDVSPTPGRTKHEIAYALAWEVRSGDGDTSTGNSASHIKAWNGVLTEHGDLVESAVAIAGDNALPMLPDAVGRDRVEALFRSFERFGYRLRLEGSGGDIYDGEFCSGRLWAIGPNRWCYGPKIGRILAKTFWELNPTTEKRGRGWLKSVAQSLDLTTAFVPVLRVIVARLLAELADVPALPLPNQGILEMYRIRPTQRHATSEETILQCAYLYHCAPGEIGALEDWLVDQPLLGADLRHPLLDRMVTIDLGSDPLW